MTTTTNRGYSTPATGSQVGIWGSSDINPNFLKVDQNLGAVCSITTTGGTITLTPDQYACGTISVSGVLTNLVDLVFPSVQGWWSIENLTSGSATRLVRVFAGALTEFIGIPPGTITDIQVNGGVVKYRNFPPVGSYLTMPSLPDWVSFSSKPPYLVCDGSTFSAGTYPALASILGGTTLPDCRGRTMFMLNQGTARLPIGDTLFAGGGAPSITLATPNLPPYTPSGGIASSFSGSVVYNGARAPALVGDNFQTYAPAGSITGNTGQWSVTGTVSSTFFGSPQGGVSSPLSTYPPALVAGVVMIRAA